MWSNSRIWLLHFVTVGVYEQETEGTRRVTIRDT